MRRRSYMRTVILLNGVIGGLGLLAMAAQADAAKPPRPAATGPSPLAANLQQLPAPAQQVGRPAKAELVSRCQQRPACWAKLDAARKGQRPVILRPAASSRSPVELKLKELPPPVTPVIPRRFQRSGLDLWWIRPLAWLNPFRTSVAEAQAGFSVYLTPQNSFVSSPSSGLSMGGLVFIRGAYMLNYGSVSNNPDSENKPYVLIDFTAPASGYYIIDVRASRAAAKLRHQAAGPIIETWDVGSVPCNAVGSLCDYVTAEYLQQGLHYFTFYAPTANFNFYSVSIESYP